MIMSASTIPKKTRRKRRNRDPTKPKRPLSAYMFYANEQRSTFREQFPTEKLMEISKRIAAAWHALDDASRDKYTSKAAVAKVLPAGHGSLEGAAARQSQETVYGVQLFHEGDASLHHCGASVVDPMRNHDQGRTRLAQRG